MIENYVALDLETTGLNPHRDRILEIGAVKICKGQVVDTYHAFVDCEMQIPEYITTLTGIDQSMLSGAASTGEAVNGLVEFCEDAPLLGHNILFDYSFVKRQAVNYNLDFEKQGVDTLKIAKKFLDEIPSRRLEALCTHYGIEQQQKHRALDDAIAASMLYQKLWEEFQQASPSAFLPKDLVFQVKKQSPITKFQKAYLIDLVKYHKIEMQVSIESLTKSEASRQIDNIILQFGRIKR